MLLWGLRDQDPGPGRTNLTAANLGPSVLLILRIICVALLCIGEAHIPSDLPEAKPRRAAAALNAEHAALVFSECLLPLRERCTCGEARFTLGLDAETSSCSRCLKVNSHFESSFLNSTVKLPSSMSDYITPCLELVAYWALNPHTFPNTLIQTNDSPREPVRCSMWHSSWH